MPDDQKSNSEEDIISEAMERFKLASEADTYWRANSLDDLKFSTGEQWDANTLAVRKGRPCLTMDQTQQAVRLVTNQYRQQPPSIGVSPVGDGADTDTAEVIQGLIRHIENVSDAQVAYEQVHDQVVRTGFGSVRIRSEYVDEDSEDQEIIIESIRNQFSVYSQPGVPDGKAKWKFIITDLPPETYKKDHPDSKISKSSEFTSIGNAQPGWVTKEYIRVAEYYEVVTEKRAGKRPKNKVIWRKIDAFDVLDTKDVPGTRIPVFTAYGDDLDVDGKRYVAGLIRNAKDPQRAYNYQTSAATEVLALTRRAPIMAAEGQLAGREKEWNDQNALVLQYKQVDVGGKPAPEPKFLTVEPAIQGIAMMTQQAKLDTKAAMGIYDPSLGQRRGDESGKAIEKLQQQGDIATFNFSDNMTRMMKPLGLSLIQWIRIVFDVAKVRRIIIPDGTPKMVITHSDPGQAEEARKLTTDKINKVYDIGTGRYDIAISVEPTYQSKRKEAVSTQLELLKTIPPNLGPTVIDLIVRNMDIPQSKEIADRFKKMLPPQLQDGDESDPEVKVQQLEATLQQMSKQHELLTKVNGELLEAMKTKQVEQQGKIQIAQMQEMTRTEIVKMQEATKIAVAQINASKDANQAFAERELEQYKLLHQSAHDLALQKDQQSHEQGLAAQQQATDQQSQQSDQQHEAGMQAQEQAGDQQSQQADQEHEQQMATVTQGDE